MWEYLSGFAAVVYFAAPIIYLTLGILPVNSISTDFFLRFIPFMVINQGLGAVKLNCLEATPAAELIEIVVIGGAGSVLLVLPPGWAVDADRLSKAWGSKRVKVPQEPTAGQPLLLISGSLGLGTFTVRPPFRFEQRRVERRLRPPELTR